MKFRLELAAEAERDFGLIFDHLVESYTGFGENAESAIERAAARVLEIRSTRDCLWPHHTGVNAMTTFCPV